MIRSSSKFALAVAITAALLVGTAPPIPALDQDGQVWFLNTARGAITERWKLYLEAQPRVDGDGMSQLLLRPAVGYQVTPNWSLWQGYGWTPSFHPFNDENRLFQQSLVETPRGDLPVSLVNRTRLEERWIEGADDVSIRLRHMLRAVYPLCADGKWALAAYDELFVTLNGAQDGPEPGFGQNRAFLGVNRELIPGVHLEVGYVNQFVNRPAGTPNVLSHNALVWLDWLW